jgi:RNA polymerase sigma-70 factor (ECF subfamily)
MEPTREDLDACERARLIKAAAGDPAAWAELLQGHRPRLRRMVALRLDHRLAGRLDPSDVLQEVSIQAARALPTYLERPELPFFLWLRWLTGRVLQGLHRRHLGVRARAAGREVRLGGGAAPEASSEALAARLLGHDTRPSTAAARDERRQRVREALDALDPVDREVLVLRHFEELTAAESARVLGIDRSAASKRYVRALRRLKERIGAMPDGGEGLRP